MGAENMDKLRERKEARKEASAAQGSEEDLGDHEFEIPQSNWGEKSEGQGEAQTPCDSAEITLIDAQTIMEEYSIARELDIDPGDGKYDKGGCLTLKAVIEATPLKEVEDKTQQTASPEEGEEGPAEQSVELSEAEIAEDE